MCAAAAEPHAAERGEGRAPLQQQAHELEVVLVPAHGDAVFGHAAEARHDAVIEILEQRRRVLHRLQRVEPERLDLEAVDGNDRVAVIEQMMREREPGRPQPHDQHLAPAVGPRQRAAQVERVPARQQRVDLEPPGQRQHVLEDRRLGLRNVDRLLLLIDAGLHAVVADAMAGRRHHRVVDRRDRGERAQHAALRAQRVHLADLLIERAAGEGHAERAIF